VPTLLQIDFPLDGPWGEEMAGAFAELAEVIEQAPGLRWKIWTENAAAGEGGGIYLFDDVGSASAYLDQHLPRLASFGVENVRAKLFDVNEPLSAVTRGPVGG
jgi:hypothetical protein